MPGTGPVGAAPGGGGGLGWVGLQRGGAWRGGGGGGVECFDCLVGDQKGRLGVRWLGGWVRFGFVRVLRLGLV